MKRKYLLITMLIAATVSFVGCFDKGTEDSHQVLDSIVLDNDAKATGSKNTKLDIEMIAKTEGISGTDNSWGSLINDKIIYYTIAPEEAGNTNLAFQNWYLDSVRVGDITDNKDKETGLNKISWQDKDFNGIVFQDYTNSREVRVVKDNKGYKFNSKGELEEIGVYEKFIEKYGEDNRQFISYVDGAIDLYGVGDDSNPKIVLLDIINNEMYEIDAYAFNDINKEVFNDIPDINDRKLVILGIEDNKIYVSLEAISTSTYMRDDSSIIGYIEGSKFTPILSSDMGIDVKVIGGAIYSNGKILFSGYAEDKNGIWNYDINTKKLAKQIDVSDESLFNFSLNPTKDKIIMTGGSYEEENTKFTMNLASINENLELSNLTSVVSSKNKSGIKSLAGWSDDGNEFYLYTSMQRYKDVIGPMETSYEVYKIK
ncbi:hypothetical protein H8S20_16380 [Clostridium sp. NSJ-6]|uniref:Lipoprotein n=1 Tax=Clostridium hominis TaxID=2763036 RepID=A0ABR7DG66_9CLOT|nr:hypothetical protein [Clostridium hominis]MBC5630437.1 hypothetical protein [Clostridium hominis]MDU2670846.1 hypothetical protein [Clostridium sp.]